MILNVVEQEKLRPRQPTKVNISLSAVSNISQYSFIFSTSNVVLAVKRNRAIDKRAAVLPFVKKRNISLSYILGKTHSTSYHLF